ncbi:hypothetical protein TcWFU_002098 [Taenia crassiceps]|uniref:Uncharacterized protein n=1 Tax=Taenia crassiceps TaxID=6207 RepID=A0ABR4Q2N4_9CEST
MPCLYLHPFCSQQAPCGESLSTFKMKERNRREGSRPNPFTVLHQRLLLRSITGKEEANKVAAYETPLRHLNAHGDVYEQRKMVDGLWWLYNWNALQEKEKWLLGCQIHCQI